MNNVSQILPLRRMTCSPDEWDAFRKEQATAVAGKIETDKSAEFAKYMEQCFLAICEELNVFDMASNWAEKTPLEKLAVADDIIRRFVARIKSDTNGGRAQKYNDMPVKPVPKIYVVSSDRGLMSVSTNGAVQVNPNSPVCNDFVRFLMALRHEATHIVDLFFPHLSPLCPGILARATAFYVGPHEDEKLYEKNPLEMNANTRLKEFGQMVKARIAMREYNRLRGLIGRGMMNNALGGIGPHVR